MPQRLYASTTLERREKLEEEEDAQFRGAAWAKYWPMDIKLLHFTTKLNKLKNTTIKL